MNKQIYKELESIMQDLATGWKLSDRCPIDVVYDFIEKLLKEQEICNDIQPIFEKEPIIHSHITDVLPEDHCLKNDCVSCDECGVMLHASNNECMQTWLETEVGNYCTKCLKLEEVLDDNYILIKGFKKKKQKEVKSE